METEHIAAIITAGLLQAAAIAPTTKKQLAIGAGVAGGTTAQEAVKLYREVLTELEQTKSP